jgi:hypothetical protein
MNQDLPNNGIPVKAWGSSLPYDLIYTTDEKEAEEWNKTNDRKLNLMFVMNQYGRNCWMPYSSKLVKLNDFYLPLAD